MAARDQSSGLPREPDDFRRLKSEFLAGVNHEIRTPLTSIVGMADLLLETPLDESQKECVVNAKTCAEEALRQLSALIEFASLAAGHMQLEEEDFDLPELLVTVVAGEASKAADKSVRLFMTAAPDLPALAYGDAMRLREILTQLLSNSIKFTPRGEIEMKVGWKAASPASFRLEVELRDTGIGMPADQLQAMFECFRQGESGMARRYSGLGLGLALVQELVHLLHGQVNAQSEPSKGTVLSFWIPLRHSSAALGGGQRRPPQSERRHYASRKQSLP
jgi:signal transduction histidine kinase